MPSSLWRLGRSTRVRTGALSTRALGAPRWLLLEDDQSTPGLRPTPRVRLGRKQPVEEGAVALEGDA
jgi:hypothetical protein